MDGFNGHTRYPHPCDTLLREPPRTILELKLDALSYVLRSKPSWWLKAKDDAIRKKWMEEAITQGFTKRQAEYVIDELQGWAGRRDETTGVQPSCFQGIWESDSLISPELRSDLIAQVKVLEDVEESAKDWHPGSNGQVLDLVHPSLFCLVYGRTHAFFKDGKLTTEAEATSLEPVPHPRSGRSFISSRFAWLPTEFYISPDGTRAEALGYINNLHPDQTEMYQVIERCLSAFIPLFERVLADVQSPFKRRITCEEYDHTPDYNYENPQESHIILPDIPEGGFSGGLDPSIEELRGRRIQVITKLANIHLTPENPSYPGGSWHVEGMLNERIVASGIYYYDEENITESRLAFRMAVEQPEFYMQDDEVGARAMWGLERDAPLVQNIGSVITKEGRCLAFPNVFQHCVSPFELADETKPGHRKILVFFLVDPELSDHMPSTSNVPMQRQGWAQNPIYSASGRSGIPQLPAEICDMIAGHLGYCMSLEEAKDYRLKLMKERTRFVRLNSEDVFEIPFNLCEH